MWLKRLYVFVCELCTSLLSRINKDIRGIMLINHISRYDGESDYEHGILSASPPSTGDLWYNIYITLCHVEQNQYLVLDVLPNKIKSNQIKQQAFPPQINGYPYLRC